MTSPRINVFVNLPQEWPIVSQILAAQEERAAKVLLEMVSGVKTWPRHLSDGEPCPHRGCASHVKTPCEVCHRQGARGEYWPLPTLDLLDPTENLNTPTI